MARTKAKYLKPYLDSSVWIAWLMDEEVAGIRRKPIVDDILQAAEKGQFKIYVSTFTMAEVYKVPGNGKPKLDPTQVAEILDIFELGYLVVVDVERNVGASAHKLCGEHKALKPGDGIHLASALRAKCDVLLAWDRPLATISREDIRIEAPQMVTEQRPLPEVEGAPD